MKDDFSLVLANIANWGILIVPVIALFVFKGLFFPFIVSKAFSFMMLIEFVFFVWLILAFKEPDYRPKISPISVSLFVFLLVLSIASYFGVDSFNSFWSNFERMEGLLMHLHLFAFFLVASSVLDKKKWLYFLNISIIVSILVSVYGLLQKLGGAEIFQSDWRIESVFGNAAYLAIYLLFHVFISLFLLVRNLNNRVLVCVYGLAALLHVIILYLSATRASILGLLAGAFVSAGLISIFEKEKIKIRKIALGIVSVCIIFTAGFFLLKDTDFIRGIPELERFSGVSFENFKNEGRYYVWPMAIEGFKERSLIGFGNENFIDIFNRQYNPAMHPFERWFDRVHNVFLDFLVAGGILGLLSYVSVFISAFYLVWKKTVFSTSEKSILSGLLAGYMINNFFVFDNLFSYIMFFTVLAFIHSESLGLRSLSGKVFKKPVIFGVTISSIFLFILSFYFFNYKPILANTNLINAITSQVIAVNSDSPENLPDTANFHARRSLDYYKKAFSYDTFGNQEIVKNAMVSALSINSLTSVSQEIKNDFFELFTKESFEILERNPDNVYLLFTLASTLKDFGQYDESIVYIERARRVSQYKQDIYFVQGFAYLGKNEFDKAEEIFKEAYLLDKGYLQSARFYIFALLENGKNREAVETFNEHKADLISDDALLNSFVAKRMFPQVLEIWQERVLRDPNDVNLRFSLAAAYYETGDRNKSIETVREAVEISKDNIAKAQAEEGLSQEEINKLVQDHQAFEASSLNLINAIRSGNVQTH